MPTPPNPVAYNYAGTLANNILKPGYTTVAIGITGPNEPNYSADYQSIKWRNGIETIDGSYWILYSDDYSQGVQPTQASGLAVGWITNNNDTDLLTLINSIPERSQQTPFEDLSTAVSWAIGTGHYAILNREYPPVAMKGNPMIAAYDPANTLCYPRVNDSLYDIIGKLAGTATKTNVTVEQDSTPFHFAFSNGYIEIPDGLDQIVTIANNTAFTFSCFINANSIGGGSNNTILQIRSAGTDWIRFYLDNGTGKLYADGNLNQNDTFSGINLNWTPSSSTWYHLAIEVYYNAPRFEADVYVNGIAQGGSTLFTSPTPGNFVSGAGSTSYIGARSGASEYWDGSIGPVHIYAGQLGSTNIGYLYDVLKIAYGY